jgi:hypothetical protein
MSWELLIQILILLIATSAVTREIVYAHWQGKCACAIATKTGDLPPKVTKP